MRITVPTPPDFSFKEAVSAHGWRRLKPYDWNDDTSTLSRVERLPDGQIATLEVSALGTSLQVDVSDDAPAAEIESIVRRMLQLDIPMTEFHAFCAAHPKLADVPAKRQGRMLVSPTMWEDVVKVICTTNTTWSQTKGMVSRIVDGPYPGEPGSPRPFPTPAQIAALPLDDFAAFARLGYRSPAVHSLAVDIVKGRIDLEALRSLPSVDLRKALLALRGVGPYAASCLMIYLGHFGTVNVDSWARMMVSKELGRPVTDKDVHAFFEPFGDWQALAYHYYPWAGEEPAY